MGTPLRSNGLAEITAITGVADKRGLLPENRGF